MRLHCVRWTLNFSFPSLPSPQLLIPLAGVFINYFRYWSNIHEVLTSILFAECCSSSKFRYTEFVKCKNVYIRDIWRLHHSKRRNANVWPSTMTIHEKFLSEAYIEFKLPACFFDKTNYIAKKFIFFPLAYRSWRNWIQALHTKMLVLCPAVWCIIFQTISSHLDITKLMPWRMGKRGKPRNIPLWKEF